MFFFFFQEHSGYPAFEDLGHYTVEDVIINATGGFELLAHIC